MRVDEKDRNEPQHLDLIEFGLAEFDLAEAAAAAESPLSATVWSPGGGEKNTKRREENLKEVNMRKWAPNRIVDYDMLKRFKRSFLTFYNEYMQMLLLFEIDKINKYTSYLELDKIFANCNTSSSSGNGAAVATSKSQPRQSLDSKILNMKKRLIVDVRTLNTLSRKCELNWLKAVNSLYPIKTIGDGNCLVCVRLCLSEHINS